MISVLRVLLHYKILSFLGSAISYDVGASAGLRIFKIGSLQLCQQQLKVQICSFFDMKKLDFAKSASRQKNY